MNKLELIYFHTSITIASPQLNGFNYCYLRLIILFNINHLFVHSEVVTSIPMSYQYFYLDSHSFKYCYLILIILFNITHSFTHG